MRGYIYIIQSQNNGRYYIGSSKNPETRLNILHNQGKVKATKYLIPWKLMFMQKYENLTVARKVEYKLKSLKSRQILEKIIKSGVCTMVVG
jgi:putative endonuclease